MTHIIIFAIVAVFVCFSLFAVWAFYNAFVKPYEDGFVEIDYNFDSVMLESENIWPQNKPGKNPQPDQAGTETESSKN